MSNWMYPARPLPWLGGPEKASSAAIAAPPPGPGEVRRIALPETFDGIRFEIGRMIRYIQAAVGDPVVAESVQATCDRHIQGLEWSAQMEGRSLDGVDPASACVEAIDLWCRRHFVYVNDPPNIEVIQTPRRMIQITKVPPEVLRHVLQPFFMAMSMVAPRQTVEAYKPPQVCFGDCDEGGTIFLAQCAACPVEIRPLLMRFGGHDDSLHHVWSRVGVGAGKFLDLDLTESDYALGDYSKFKHYEEVEVPLGDTQPLLGLPELRITMGLHLEGEEEACDAVSEMPTGIRRLAEKIANGRKDAVLVDCARLVGVHYGKMVEHFSSLEGHPVSAHNNKTLFLEGLDLWCRWLFSAPRESRGSTEDPREVVAHVMRPWYEALETDDPAAYRMPAQPPPPAYKGSPEDATCVALALNAGLDITPIRLVFGLKDGEPVRTWGKVQADGQWYDTDVNDPSLALGEKVEHEDYKEVEVPL
jgi:hypothetical protein